MSIYWLVLARDRWENVLWEVFIHTRQGRLQQWVEGSTTPTPLGLIRQSFIVYETPGTRYNAGSYVSVASTYPVRTFASCFLAYVMVRTLLCSVPLVLASVALCWCSRRSIRLWSTCSNQQMQSNALICHDTNPLHGPYEQRHPSHKEPVPLGRLGGLATWQKHDEETLKKSLDRNIFFWATSALQ